MLQIVHDWFLDAPFNIFQLYQGRAEFFMCTPGSDIKSLCSAIFFPITQRHSHIKSSASNVDCTQGL